MMYLVLVFALENVVLRFWYWYKFKIPHRTVTFWECQRNSSNMGSYHKCSLAQLSNTFISFTRFCEHPAESFSE